MFEMYEDERAYYKEMNRQAYGYNSGGNKKKSQDQVWFSFLTALQFRCRFDFESYPDKYPGIITYKRYPGLSDALARSGDKNFYQLKGWFNNNFQDKWCYWSSEDWKFAGKGNPVLEDAIKDVLMPFADKIQAFKCKDKAKDDIVIERPKTEVIEPKNEEIKRGKGRPLGSKNKKAPKELFMPDNIVKIDDGKVNMESFILAVADLVWRKPGMMDGYYLDLLNLNEGQRKYINKLFMIGSDLLCNKYWSVEKKGKINVINPKMRRAGYYSNKQHKLLSLTWMSEQTGISKMTLQDRLQKMSIKDAIKKSQ